MRADSPVQPVQRRPLVRRVRRSPDDGATPGGRPRTGLGKPLPQQAPSAPGSPAPVTPVQKATTAAPSTQPPAPAPTPEPRPTAPTPAPTPAASKPLPVVPLNRSVTPASYRPAAAAAALPLAPSRSLTVQPAAADHVAASPRAPEGRPVPTPVPLQRSAGTSTTAAADTAPVVVPLGKPGPRAPRRPASPAPAPPAAPTAPGFTSVPAAPPVRTSVQPPARPATVQRRSAQPAPTPVPAPAPTPAPAPAARHPHTATTTTASTATPPTPGETGNGGGASPGASASRPPASESSPAELDDLARRLLAPLSRLLRAELRGDRERIGRLRDHGR
ncbi:hypothetical protein [Streptomyces sp. KN37]|uniref:hypothetical protein n=1 Tax=Streptomyces sp. KN37 TaxID=3090667 RepID=UPI002A763982|nr:hypothetical protein [Streptomyces sp. KN37]WPO70764.1 hypothetical protein R9806_09055 [Streptomyces sp. KN37]